MCFFFSSRRRHTRWPRDWSSDVCSSDLKPITDSPELMFNAVRDQLDQQYFNEDDELIIEETVKEAYDLTTKMLQEDLVGKNELWTPEWGSAMAEDRKSTRLNSSHVAISYAV